MSAVLFCPFCRECFEGETECPDHELALVPFEKLPRPPARLPSDDEPVGPLEPRYGRAWFGGGAVLILVGFFVPTLVIADGARATSFSLLDLASTKATNLWTVPAAAVAGLGMLARVRRPRDLGRVRLAALAMPAFVALSLGLSLQRMFAALGEGALGSVLTPTPAAALFVLGWGASVWGALTLGRGGAVAGAPLGH